jgi:DNA-binding winged helix-turn-helix (wHTH) protein/tetratricopeptide (TPR) repeat protein
MLGRAVLQVRSTARFARFGSFQVDLRERKLTKAGSHVRVQEQPLRILILLLERSGELVTREEIREQVWPHEFVDFDAALNTATRKLREALNDSADNPRFVETVPRRGYRFVAPVAWAPEVDAVAPIESPVRKHSHVWLSAAALCLAGVAVIGFWVSIRAHSKFTPEDTIVLADFLNKTGDTTFDDSLNTALSLSLRQSPFFKVLSDSEVAITLQRMTRPAGTRLTTEVARELCQRAGSKAYLVGSIATLGSKYVLGLKAVNCQNGDTLALEQSVATSQDNVLDALDDAASRLRRELGESLVSVLKFDVPLARATTPSFDALREYSLGLKAFSEKGPFASLPYFQRVLDLDPNCALAYRAIGLDYSGLGEVDRANEYFSKAFQLRDHVSEWEKLAITGDYYLNVTGELDKATETYEQWIKSYPRDDGPYSTLGIVYALQGQYEKASEVTRRALQLAPSFGSYGNLAIFALALQHFDEGLAIIRNAQARKIDGFEFRTALYALAFFAKDSVSMTEQQNWFAGKPEENMALALASDTEAYQGHLAKAQELTMQAVESAIRANGKENAAIWLANGALRQAAFGDAAGARKDAARALKLSPTSQGTEVEAALAFAMADDAPRAESLAQDLEKRFPLDTQMQYLWLPAIEMQMLSRKDHTSILKTSQSAPLIEYGTILFVANPSCLYPTYIRGEAYLEAGQGTLAAAEFQKILDHSGIVWNCWTGALAHLGMARAQALQANTSPGGNVAARARALTAYTDFFRLWKNADPDIPVYIAARAEYASLQSAR